jgi:hypothetical protein
MVPKLDDNPVGEDFIPASSPVKSKRQKLIHEKGEFVDVVDLTVEPTNGSAGEVLAACTDAKGKTAAQPLFF